MLLLLHALSLKCPIDARVDQGSAELRGEVGSIGSSAAMATQEEEQM